MEACTNARIHIDRRNVVADLSCSEPGGLDKKYHNCVWKFSNEYEMQGETGQKLMLNKLNKELKARTFRKFDIIV